MKHRIVFGQPQFGDEEIDLVAATLRSAWIGQGPLVEEFERRLGEEVWEDHVVAVSSCTTGLELALQAIGVGPGDEVITTPLTFVATVNAIESTGATPVLVDIDAETLLITPDAVASVLTERTRAVMPVSFGGRPLDVTGFLELAERNDLIIVEDAAHSIGTVADGMPTGATRNPRLLTVFSFYPNKNLASAEGGAVTTCDEALAERLRSLRLHGLNADAWRRYRERGYQVTLATDRGQKANWTDLQAAIAIPQLEKLQGFLAAREYIASCYDKLLVDHPGVELINRPTPGVNQRHGLHLYQVKVPAARRDGLVEVLRSEGIGAAVHYPPIHFHPYYERLDTDRLGVVEAVAPRLLSLPLHPGLDDDDVKTVASRVLTRLD